MASINSPAQLEGQKERKKNEWKNKSMLDSSVLLLPKNYCTTFKLINWMVSAHSVTWWNLESPGKEMISGHACGE